MRPIGVISRTETGVSICARDDKPRTKAGEITIARTKTIRASIASFIKAQVAHSEPAHSCKCGINVNKTQQIANIAHKIKAILLALTFFMLSLLSFFICNSIIDLFFAHVNIINILFTKGADSFRYNRKKKRKKRICHFSRLNKPYRRKSEVENLRFSPFFIKFFFLSSFGRSAVYIYAYVRPNEDFSSKSIEPRKVLRIKNSVFLACILFV